MVVIVKVITFYLGDFGLVAVREDVEVGGEGDEEEWHREERLDHRWY